MKKLPLLTLLLGITGSAALAATFSGTVRSVAACGPAVGQKVYIYDTTHSYLDSAVTNSSGQYSFTLPGTLTTPTSLWYYTNSCGTQIKYASQYSGSNLTNMDFTICGSTKQLKGYAQLNGSNITGPTKIYLIRKKYDPSVGAVTLTAIDSMSSGSSAVSYYSFYSLCVPTDTMLVKAVLQPGHTAYSTTLPTYYGGSTSWSGATPIPASAWTTNTMTNIAMASGSNPGGPGFIGGSVLLGANKTSGVGDPLAQRIIILTNAANQPMAYTYSDASGRFQFSNLPYGTFKLSGDAWGKNNPALSVTISSSKASVTNVLFQENDSRFWGQIGGVGINDATGALAGVQVYPNPASSFIRLSGLGAISGAKTLTLRSMTGALISQTMVTGADAQIATESLAAGIYQLQLSTEAGSAVYQIVK